MLGNLVHLFLEMTPCLWVVISQMIQDNYVVWKHQEQIIQ